MKKAFFTFFYLVAVGFRLCSLPLFVWIPITAWILVFLADYVDYGLAIRAGFTYKTYQYVDKTVDFITRIYFVVAAFVLGWPLGWMFVVLFVLRTIGDTIYLFTKSEKYMFYFPNIIEFFFFLYALYLRYWTGEDPYFLIVGILLVIATITKVWHEHLLHVQKWIDPISLRYLQNHPEHGRVVEKDRKKGRK